MKKEIIDFWGNIIEQNQQEVYNNMTKFFIKNHGYKFVGKAVNNLVYSIWGFDDCTVYLELHGGDCYYLFID